MRAYRKIDDGYESKMEPGRLVLLGIGIFLTVVLVFLVGVLVGKGLWAGKTSSAGAQAEGRPEPPPPGSGPKYTFYEELKQPDSREVALSSPAPSPAEGASTPIAAQRTEPLPQPLYTEAAPAAAAPSPPVPAAVAGGYGAPVVAKAEPAPTLPPPDKVSAEGGGRSDKAALKDASAAPSAAKAKPAATEQVKAETAKPLERSDAEKGGKSREVAQVLPKPTPKPSPKPSPTPSPKPEAKLPAASFTVQIGSYKEKGPAEQQVKEMAQKGVAAQVVAVPVQGRTWYRVQAGQFGTRAEAENHLKKKVKGAGVQGFVTAR